MCIGYIRKTRAHNLYLPFFSFTPRVLTVKKERIPLQHPFSSDILAF